jgi:hypothetical protein
MAIWSANTGMKAIFDALNVVYEETEKRSFLRLNLTSLAFTVAALAAILAMIGGVIAVPLALQRLGLGERGEWIVAVGRWPALLCLLLTALAVLYRTEPRPCTLAMAEHRRPRRQHILADRLFTAVLVSGQFRQLHRHLWFARGCNRPDDLDVDVRHHCPVRSRAQFGNRAVHRRGAGFFGSRIESNRRWNVPLCEA